MERIKRLGIRWANGRVEPKLGRVCIAVSKISINVCNSIETKESGWVDGLCGGIRYLLSNLKRPFVPLELDANKHARRICRAC